MNNKIQGLKKDWALLCLPWILLISLYSPIFWQLIKSGWDIVDYSHAYFILPVALMLGWHSLRGKSKVAASSVTPIHGILLVIGLLFFNIAWRQQYLFISTLSLLPVTYGLIGLLYGSGIAKKLSLPILYLLFLVPPPLGLLDNITIPLRYGVSIATEHIVRMMGYPITRDGLLLNIDNHEVFLGEACSGFRSIVTLASLGLAYIYIASCSSNRKWLMIGSILPLALLGNLIRVISVVIVTFYLGESRGQQYFHDFSGYAMFVVMIAGLLAVEKIKFKK